MSKPNRVILWSAPRCISTAFERSIKEIEGVKILHEPYSIPYYFGPERQSKRYTGVAIREKVTYESITEYIRSVCDENEIVFQKELAYYFDNRHHIALSSQFCATENTFLIRHPMKTVLSLYKGSIDKEKTGWDYFEPIEVGINSLRELYDDIKNHYGYQPIVIDADDLLSDPAFIMESYCKHVGLTYSDKMLSWKAGVIPEWTAFDGWHDNVFNSTGFSKEDSASKELSRLKKEREYATAPEIVKKTIKDNMEAFNYLYEQRIKLPTA